MIKAKRVHRRVETGVELWTVQKAKKQLALNPRNRKLKDHRVKKYAREMDEGEWLTAEAITIDWNGNLVNGQHRLAAVVHRGKAQKFVTIRGVDPRAFSVIDTGMARSPGQIFAMYGEKDTNNLHAACRLMLRYERGELLTTSQYVRDLSAESMYHLFNEKWPEMRESVKKSGKVRKVLAGSWAAFCHYLTAQQDPDDADVFADMVATGEMLKQTDPALVLRNRLLAEKAAKKKLPKVALAALYIRAWNNYRRGKRSKSLQALKDTDPFPAPV